MFAFLRSLFVRRRPSLFRYHDGQRFRFADPIAVYRMLWIECGGNPQDLLASSESATPQLAVPSAEKMVGAVRRVFALAPFDSETGGGCTDADAYAVLDGFCDFLDEKKKKPVN